MTNAFYADLAVALQRKKLDKDAATKLKIGLAAKHGLSKIPNDIEVYLNIPPDAARQLKQQLRIKPVRTISGIASISIMTKPYGCPHGRCTFCPGGPKSVFGDVPQSYTGREPATMRAIRAAFDPYLQVFSRLEQYAVTGQSFDATPSQDFVGRITLNLKLVNAGPAINSAMFFKVVAAGFSPP